MADGAPSPDILQRMNQMQHTGGGGGGGAQAGPPQDSLMPLVENSALSQFTGLHSLGFMGQYELSGAHNFAEVAAIVQGFAGPVDVIGMKAVGEAFSRVISSEGGGIPGEVSGEPGQPQQQPDGGGMAQPGGGDPSQSQQQQNSGNYPPGAGGGNPNQYNPNANQGQYQPQPGGGGQNYGNNMANAGGRGGGPGGGPGGGGQAETEGNRLDRQQQSNYYGSGGGPGEPLFSGRDEVGSSGGQVELDRGYAPPERQDNQQPAMNELDGLMDMSPDVSAMPPPGNDMGNAPDQGLDNDFESPTPSHSKARRKGNVKSKGNVKRGSAVSPDASPNNARDRGQGQSF